MTEAVHAARIARLGMWLFLATEAMMFGALFLALSVCRWRVAAAWREASAHLHLWLGTANTAVLMTSSLAVALAVMGARAEQWRQTAWRLGAGAMLGTMFLAIKGCEYWLEYKDGLMPGTAPAFRLADPGARLFFDLYFLATGLHAVHLSIGIALVGALAVAAARRKLEPKTVELTGLYWHFVDIVWVFLFPILYLAAPR